MPPIPGGGSEGRRSAPRCARTSAFPRINARVWPSAAVVAELKSAAEILLAQLAHGFLELILGRRADADLVRHDRGLDLLQLPLLQELDDLLCRLGGDPLLQRDRAPHGVVGGALDV